MTTTTANLGLFKYTIDDADLDFNAQLALNDNWDKIDLVWGEGGSGINVDTILDNTSTNPVQNKVLYPSLSKYIPDNTHFLIKANGEGHFTSIGEAINFLSQKWSSGHVYLDLYGNITETSAVTINWRQFNIPYLWIRGRDTNPTITFTNTNTCFILSNISGTLQIVDLNLICSNGTTSKDYALIQVGLASNVVVNNCNLTGGCVNSNGGSLVQIPSSLVINNSKYGLKASQGRIISYGNTNTTISSNCDTLLYTEFGGYISIVSSKKTFTGTTVSNVTMGSYTEKGYIIYPDNW